MISILKVLKKLSTTVMQLKCREFKHFKHMTNESKDITHIIPIPLSINITNSNKKI